MPIIQHQSDFISEIIAEFQDIERLSERGYNFDVSSFFVDAADEDREGQLDEVNSTLKRASTNSENVRILVLMS
jgi:hypothetical protein